MPLSKTPKFFEASSAFSITCVNGPLVFFTKSSMKWIFLFCRWVNIGKERDGMNPDAVQYARALRPPYHLLSFLRIKGYSTKGMSCTDKNTMVRMKLKKRLQIDWVGQRI